eukprot:SAG22_NODE_305_length_12688_cov_24.723330_4_plen_203_part_00
MTAPLPAGAGSGGGTPGRHNPASAVTPRSIERWYLGTVRSLCRQRDSLESRLRAAETEHDAEMERLEQGYALQLAERDRTIRKLRHEHEQAAANEAVHLHMIANLQESKRRVLEHAGSLRSARSLGVVRPAPAGEAATGLAAEETELQHCRQTIATQEQTILQGRKKVAALCVRVDSLSAAARSKVERPPLCTRCQQKPRAA